MTKKPNRRHNEPNKQTMFEPCALLLTLTTIN